MKRETGENPVFFMWGNYAKFISLFSKFRVWILSMSQRGREHQLFILFLPSLLHGEMPWGLQVYRSKRKENQRMYELYIPT